MVRKCLVSLPLLLGLWLACDLGGPRGEPEPPLKGQSPPAGDRARLSNPFVLAGQTLPARPARAAAAKSISSDDTTEGRVPLALTGVAPVAAPRPHGVAAVNPRASALPDTLYVFMSLQL